MGAFIFDDEVLQAVRPETGPVGGATRLRPITLTRIVHDAGEWCFGPEIPALFGEVRHRIERRSKPGFTFARQEIRIAEADANGIDAGWMTLVAEHPPAQRHVCMAPVLARLRGRMPRHFEEYPLSDVLQAGEDPAALSQDDAIAAIHRLGKNVLETDKWWVSPILLGRADPESIFPPDSFPEEKSARRDTRNQKAGRGSGYAFGIARKDVRRLVWDIAENSKTLKSLSDRAWDESLEVRAGPAGPRLRLTDRALRRADTLRLESIVQALAGAGTDVAAWEGKPVGLLAARFFENHLVNAVKKDWAGLKNPGNMIELTEFFESSAQDDEDAMLERAFAENRNRRARRPGSR